MYLLQEGIAGGAYLLTAICIAFFIGVPIVTILLKRVFEKQEDKMQAQRKDFKTQNDKDSIQDKPRNTLIPRIVLAVIIVVSIIVIVIKIFGSSFQYD